MGSVTIPLSLPTKLWINDQYVESTGDQTLTLFNPTDDTLLTDKVQVASPADIDVAVEAANAASKGSWASFSGRQRAACLLKFADLVEANQEMLATLESLPTGRPVSGIMGFDIAHMIEVYSCQDYAGWADKIEDKSFPADDGYYKIVRHEPIGVCAGIVSWNATMMYVGWKIAPALAAGNTFIFKSSEKSPLAVLALGPLYKDAGFPPGVVQIVSGATTTGAALASHGGIRKISFTGSSLAGRKVQEAATKSNLKKVTLELGGKTAAIVFNDADVDLVVGSVAAGFLANSGQICVAASRALVHKSIATEFVAAAKNAFESACAAMGASSLDKTTAHGPVVDRQQFDRVMGFIEQGKKDAHLVTGGKRRGSSGCFIEPTIFLDPPTDSSIWREEIFGPVLCVKSFETEEEAIEMANDTEYGLAACLYTKSLSRALRISAKLESGGVSVNSPHLPMANTPFGGIKQSGYGRELGLECLMENMHTKSLHIKL